MTIAMKNKLFFGFLAYMMILCVTYSCTESNSKNSKYLSIDTNEDTTTRLTERYKYQIDTPICNENGCTGKYIGVEFVNEEYKQKLGLTGTDIAHNYSNLMCKYVGRKLKELYREGKFSKVVLNKIRISTKGMGDGKGHVEYIVSIPFKRVEKRSQAMTGFDHSGGWGHPPELAKRKYQLLHSKKRIVKNRKLYVSRLTQTPEGLKEYWIQWKHADY